MIKGTKTALAIALVAMATGPAVSVAQNQRSNSRKQDFEMGKSIEIMSNIMRDATIFYVDSTSPSEMLEDAARGMLSNMDPYTEYLPESQMQDFEVITTGKYGGVGSMIRQSGEWIEFSEPYKNSPSDKAGIRSGDRIVEINGIPMKGKDAAAVSSQLKGKPHTKLTIKIRPIKDTTTLKEVVVVRETVSIPAVPYSGMLNSEVGYIRLDSFSGNAAADVKQKLEELLLNKGLKGLVLDLRGNGGGLVDEAVKILGLFLPKGSPVVDIKGKMELYNSSHKTHGQPLSPNIKLAVLINSSSASASEIVSGTIQDLDRGVVIGSRSFGKGLVQVTRNVGYNSYIKLTTAKYYIPSGRSIQALDYSSRRADGSVGHIPDSLIKEYKTLNGRSVYDGGGITPDIEIAPEYYNKFTAIIYALGYIDDFANQYAAKYDKGDIETFEVSDSLYQAFSDYILSKTIAWESPTKIKLKELEKIARQEKYLDTIQSQLNVISEKIKEDSSRELRTFAPEIKATLGTAIITRWHYAPGGIRWSIKEDKEIKKAVEVITDNDLYQEILTTSHILKK